MTAYYNEIDPFAAEWLRNLIAAGHIAPGDVDERSIEDVSPDDLRGYTQCHFFAGIGVWSYALRRAGWPDDRPVWTGSCPCPPFSAAGKGSECPSCGGKSCLSHPLVTAGWVCLDCGDEWRGDDRHLLPEFIRLKGQCRPPVVFGEQVASRDGRLWLYTLRAVMEEARYAVGAADLCAAGVGAPHIRQRLWFVEERLADAECFGRERRGPTEAGYAGRQEAFAAIDGSRNVGWLAYTDDAGPQRRPFPAERTGERLAGPSGVAGGLEHAKSDRRQQRRPEPSGRGSTGRCGTGGLDNAASARHVGALEDAEGNSRHEARLRVSGKGRGPCGLADADGRNPGAEGLQRGGQYGQQPQDGGVSGLADAELQQRQDGQSSICAEHEARGREQGAAATSGLRDDHRPGPTNGFWRDADWLFCRDGKWRPVEPGTFPLAHGAPARVGRLRAYGNAIVAQAAQLFIESYLETQQEQQHGCQENPDPDLGRSVEG